MYMTTLPVADARARLSKIVDDAEQTHARYEITRNGHRAAVLLAADDFDALQETIAVLSDQELLTSHLRGVAELPEGGHAGRWPVCPRVSEPEAPYRLVIARSASRAISHTLPEKVAAAVYEFITGALLENPQRVGKPPAPPLSPAYSARRGTYRVLYLIDTGRRTVQVTAISHRSDAYR